MKKEIKKYFVYHEELGFVKFTSLYKTTLYDYPEPRAAFERLKDAQSRLDDGVSVRDLAGANRKHECKIVCVTFEWSVEDV